jgi:Fungal specific transcription factor domain
VRSESNDSHNPQNSHSQSLLPRECDDEDSGIQSDLVAPVAGAVNLQPIFTATASTFEGVPLIPNYPCNMSFPGFSAASHQGSVQADDNLLEQTAPGFHASGPDPFGTGAPDIFWDDAQFLHTFYQGPYSDFGFAMPTDETLPSHMDMALSEPELDQNSKSAPVPSFLDARSSPEPMEGQSLRWDDYIRRTFANRRHLRSEEGIDGTGHSMRTSAGRLEKAHAPPLMGEFPSVLSSENKDNIWAPENLAHVRPLPQQVYNQIAARFEDFNVTKGQYTQFASGAFPSLAACNAFMQLFFEEFNPLFPFLHQPTFDPAIEPWLLVLAVIATGCRFSRIPAAVESGDLMQEFLRRAFFAMVRALSFRLI